MFVDDDPALLEGVRRALHMAKRDWQLSFYEYPDKAIKAFEIDKADVVVSDMNMPEIDGLELVRALMRLDPNGESRFMYLTGTGDFNTVVRAINELKVYRFLQKPIVRDKLVEFISEALEDIYSESLVGGRHAAAALQMINAAVLVLSGTGELLYSNPAGRVLLDRPGGILLGKDNICRGKTAIKTKEFHAMLQATVSDKEDLLRWVKLEADGWCPEVHLVAIPQGKFGDTRSVVLLSTDPEEESSLDAQALQSMFGLTRAEATITLALTRGKRLEEAAENSGVTVSSARTYLKRVFVKTGATHQADLVKMVLTSPAALLKKA